MDNSQAIRKLIWANAISGFAQGISMIAIPQYFINVLHEKTAYNQLFLYVTLTVLLWGPYAGSLVDRYHRKWLFFGLNVMGSVILLTAALFGFITGSVNEWVTGLVFVFTILNYNLHYPALYAFTHELIAGKDYARINSKLEIQSQVTSMLSGAVAAIILSGIEYQGTVYFRVPLQAIFLIDGITYIIGALLVYSITYVPVTTDTIDTSSILERLKKGWLYLLKNKAVLVFGLCSYVVFATLIVFAYYVMQVYVFEKLVDDAIQQTREIAWIIAISEVCYTLGAVASGYATQKIIQKIDKLYLVLIYMAVTVLLLFSLMLFPSVAMFMVASAFYGLTNSGIRIARVTWMFERVPNRMLGRSGSVFNNFNVLFRLFFIFMAGTSFMDKEVNYALLMLAGSILLAMVPLMIFRRKFISRGMGS